MDTLDSSVVDTGVSNVNPIMDMLVTTVPTNRKQDPESLSASENLSHTIYSLGNCLEHVPWPLM